MSKELIIDESECTGCELCVDMLPAVFKMNSSGISHVYNISGAKEKEIQDVVDNCPAECIIWK